jgi:hypothetical protein
MHACSHPQVAQFVHDPQFDPTIVARSSISAAALAKWVIAMDDYQRVKKVSRVKRGLPSQQTCRPAVLHSLQPTFV